MISVVNIDMYVGTSAYTGGELASCEVDLARRNDENKPVRPSLVLPSLRHDLAAILSWAEGVPVNWNVDSAVMGWGRIEPVFTLKLFYSLTKWPIPKTRPAWDYAWEAFHGGSYELWDETERPLA